MKIEILGMGCPKCKMLHERVVNALANLDVAADVQKIENPLEIAKYGVLTTPGLVINGKVKAAGRLPDDLQIQQWIKEEIGSQ